MREKNTLNSFADLKGIFFKYTEMTFEKRKYNSYFLQNTTTGEFRSMSTSLFFFWQKQTHVSKKIPCSIKLLKSAKTHISFDADDQTNADDEK